MITSVAFAAAASASAQTAPAAQAAATDTSTSGATAVQELVVTGSRIPQPNLTSIQPLTTLNSQDVKLAGAVDILQLLNQLPQAFANQTAQVSNGSTGTAEADLRNLGVVRTLVLVNGKRLMPGDPSAAGLAPDLNNIPTALVERVDVVTGGNSAIYGSDAVAGVINFILKKNFEGVQVDYQYSFDNHQQGNLGAQHALNLKGYPIPGNITADGGINNVSIIVGTSSPDDKGNVTAYATYRSTEAILQASRDFSYCGISTVGNLNNQHVCAGSSNSAYGRFHLSGTNQSFADNPNGTSTFVPYNSSLAYNFNPLNYIQREDQLYTAGFFAHYEINKMAEVYTDFMFMDDQTDAQIAPSGLFQNSGPNLASGYTFNCNNPLMSDSQATALGCVGRVAGAPGGQMLTDTSIGYRFASVPRISDITHTDYKVDVGLRGDLGDGWNYDAYLSLGVARLSEQVTGYASETAVQNALNVVNGPNGKPVCVIGGTCVPLNIFQAQSAGFTQAALQYVLAPGITTGETSQQVAEINVTGDLGRYGIKSPWATDGFGVNIGADYRRDYLNENFDALQQEGDLSGSGGALLPVANAVNVKEIFFEVRAPIAHDQPGIKDLTLDGGYRFSAYNVAGNTNTYKIGLEYYPIQDLLLRGSYNYAVRAPNVQDLYAPNVVGLAGYQDPCAAPDPTTANPNPVPSASLAQCANTGVTAAQYGHITNCPAGQCSALFGGGAATTNLRPEEADTYTVGFVYQPSQLPGFSFSTDYWNIKVNNVISAGIAAPQTILGGCLASATSPDCALIHRDPVTGGLNTAQGYILQTSINAGYIATDGIDFSLNYHMTLPPFNSGGPSAGGLALAFQGTWVNHLTAQPTPGGGTYNCAGLYGPECSSQFGSPATPAFRSTTRVTWSTPWKLDVSVQWRYISSVSLDFLSPNPLLNGAINGGPVVDPIDSPIMAYNYFDLAFTYKVKDGLVLRTGVNNIFDLDPPVVDANSIPISAPPYGNGNTFPGVYDSLGRYIFVGLTANF